MEIKARFSKGDKVYVADTEYRENWIACPDCLGTLHWVVVFANGDAVQIECQTCKQGYEPSRGKIDVKSYLPVVRELTVGSIRFDDTEKEQFSYMCEETGVGSGRVYYDSDIFTDKASATVRANEKNQDQMKSIAQNNFSKRFGGTKEIEQVLSHWGFSRKMQVEKANMFKRWAKISGIIK